MCARHLVQLRKQNGGGESSSRDWKEVTDSATEAHNSSPISMLRPTVPLVPSLLGTAPYPACSSQQGAPHQSLSLLTSQGTLHLGVDDGAI